MINPVRAASRDLVRELDMIKGHFKATGLAHTECHTLVELEQRGILTVQELSDILNLDKSNTSRTVAGLLKKNLIKIIKDGKDNRQKPFKLTDKGFEALKKLNKEVNAQVSSALSLLPDNERETILRGIEIYAKALKKIRKQSMYEVRPIKKSDNDSMARVIQQVMTEYGATGPGYSIVDNEVQNMYEHYNDERSVYYVIVKNGEVYGGAGIAHLEGGDKDTCELKKMYFLKDVRGIGFGDKLLELCVDEAKKRGYKKCYLETLGRMPEARSLYEKHGFKKLCGPLGNTGHFKCEAWYEMAL